ASGTLLLDLKARTWSSEILQSLDIPAHWLPKVDESPEATGNVTNDIATRLGLAKHPSRRRRRRQRGRGGGQWHRQRRTGQLLDRNQRCPVRALRRNRDRRQRSRPRVLPRRPESLPPDGRDAGSGRIAAMVA